jgi:hypothetical protein
MLQPPLTTDPDRRRIYPDDIYFREAATQLAELPPEVRDRILRRTTFVLFKPEALAGRRIERALRFARDHGFEPIGACRVPADRHTVRNLWRYQLNAAPLPVVSVVDMIVATADCVFVAFFDRDNGSTDNGSATDGSGDGLPATTGLSNLKGSSRDPAAGAGLLRATLACTTLCLNFVHAPDEPADMVRELGVLFDQAGRAEALRILSREPVADGWLAEVTPVVQRAYAELPPHDLDLASSRAALRRATATFAELAGPAGEVIDSLAHGAGELDLLRLIDWLDHADCELGRWDRITLAAHLVGTQQPFRMPLIGPPPGPRAHARRAAVAREMARRTATTPPH